MALVAIVGRPNVGKSTLFNRLVGMRQAIVDETAGVTRDRHYGKCEWCGREFSVVDTGGYTSNSDDVFEDAIRRQVGIAIEEADVVLFMCEAATGITDTLACGAEHASEEDCETVASSLADTAAWSLEKRTEEQIRKLLQEGLSYGAAWETAARENHKDAGWFSGANNVLALAYQKAVMRHQLPLSLFPLPRQGSAYNETVLTPPYASATAIRRALQEGVSLSVLRSVMPDNAVTELEKSAVSYPSLFAARDNILSVLLTYLLARNNGQSLYEQSSASRDLCDRFSNARQELQNGSNAFCAAVASKRDSLPSVRRFSLQLLLQMPREFWTAVPDPCFLRVLAFNERGRGLLKEMKQTAALPVITKLGSLEQYRNTDLYPLLQLDAAAADLFRLLQGNTGCYGTDFTTSPVYIKQT